MVLVPMGQRGPITSASKEGKLQPASIGQELHRQRHDLEGRTDFTVNYTKLKGKNNVKLDHQLGPNHKEKIASCKMALVIYLLIVKPL